VDAEGEANVWIGHLCGVAEDVDGQAADGRQEKFDIVTGDEFGVGATGFFEQGSPERALV
jgi:hypothetical protein